MTIVQLDSVSALCRSHYLPFFARLGPYPRTRLDDWLWRSGENHEFLAHEASITAMDVYPLLRHRMDEPLWKSMAAFREEHPEYLAAVRDEIDARGALSVKDLTEPGGRTGPWWGWSKGKVGLEAMYRCGELSIAERDAQFITRYDLPERIVPAVYRDAVPPSPEAARRDMLLLAARSHGIGTDKDLADYFRLKVRDCRPLLEALVHEGVLEAVSVEGWRERAYVLPGTRCPRRVEARALLSPFDPIVWCRPRALRLFDFHYRIEIYVPEPKRVFGYYVLPFLLGDALVARVDLKADRKAGVLHARGAFLEPGQDGAQVAEAMSTALREMAEWLGLERVEVGSRGDLAGALKRACRAG